MLPMLQNLLPGPDQLPVKWLRLLALDIKVQETSFKHAHCGTREVVG